MNDSRRMRRPLTVVGAVTTALIAPLLVASPALAASPLEHVDFTDGVETGGEVDFAAGSDVTIVLNGQTTGEYSFFGCWDVAVGDLVPAGPTVSDGFTWTAGTAVDTIFTDIDLDPAASTEYNIRIWDTVEPTVPCDYDSETNRGTIAFITMNIIVAETMTLTGEAKLGSTVTVTAKVPGSLVGDDFDLWVCPDRTIYPDDAKTGENGDCFGPIIQPRDGADTVSFLLGFDPERDGADNTEAQEFWQEACDQHFIVHDFSGGGHSNWIGPVDCAVTPELAATGVDYTASAISIGALAALLLGGTLVLVRRTMRVSAR